MENSKKNQAVQVSNSYWIKVVAIFFVGWILMYATRTIFNPVMGVIGEQFGLSNTQLGLANSIFFLTYAVAQIPFGMIGDKIGRKLVIAVGFIVLAISTYFSGLATTFVMFLVIRAIAGIGQGAYYGPQRYRQKRFQQVNGPSVMPSSIVGWPSVHQVGTYFQVSWF